MTMFMVLSSWHCRFGSLPGLFNECSTRAEQPPTFGPSQVSCVMVVCEYFRSSLVHVLCLNQFRFFFCGPAWFSGQFLGGIALTAQVILPIATHFSVAWSVCLSVCLSHLCPMLKPFDGF